MSKPAELPIAHKVRVDAIPAAGMDVTIDAAEPVRAALARLVGIIAIEQLRGNLHAAPEGERVRVTGSVSGRALQACVVTLEPVPQNVDVVVEAVFAPPDEAEALMRKAGIPTESDLETLGFDEHDLAGIDLDMLSDPDALPEPFVDGRIDFGQLVYESFVTELDPYPRKDGVEFVPPAEDEGFGNPFAVLKGFKRDS